MLLLAVLRRAGQPVFQIGFALPSGGDRAVERGDDLADFALDRRADIGQLLFGRTASRMRRAEPAGQIGDVARDLGLLGAQLLHDRRGQDIGIGGRTGMAGAVGLGRTGLCLSEIGRVPGRAAN
ncbi:MAG: hypothetical protein WDN69_15890 [Aliidongia sp.]